MPTGRAPASTPMRNSAGRMTACITVSRAANRAGNQGGSTPLAANPAKIATNTNASVKASATLPNRDSTRKRRAIAPSR